MLTIRRGFTLVELMFVVAIIAVIAAVAMPAYREQMLRNASSECQSVMLDVGMLLAGHRSRNFSFKGFNLTAYPKLSGATSSTFYCPANATASTAKYTVSLVDQFNSVELTSATSDGRVWNMIAIPSTNYSSGDYLFLSSDSTRCKTRTTELKKESTTCGVGAKRWE